MKKRIVIPYLLLAAAVVIALLMFFRTDSLQRQLGEEKAKMIRFNGQLENYHHLEAIDSLMLRGDYKTAMYKYAGLLKETRDTNSADGIALRMAFAKKIQDFQNDGIAQSKKKMVDTIRKPLLASPNEIKRYDSLSFAHEKAKIQVARLQKQLQQRSLGEYLKFKSKKGNQLHYVGQVKNKEANGIGIALLDTGSRYEGEWKNNQRHGNGTFYWPDGEYYTGAYENDKRNGLGTYYWPNGEKYVGFWKDDKRNGQGEFYASDGSILTAGVWKNDKLVSPEKREKRAGR